MIDRREEILARLRIIIEDVPGVREVARNREDISAARRPAIILHDAAESSSGLNARPRFAPNDMIVLTPQIFILLGERTEVVGSKISEFRDPLIKLIYTDAILKDLVSSQGDIHYTGCGLDTTQGENREARLEVSFEFTYPLKMAELTGA